MREAVAKDEGQAYPQRRHFRWARWALALLVSSACGSADDKFAAQTSDEYTEPLGEVTIGEPGGRVTTFSGSAALLTPQGVLAEDGGADFPDVRSSFDSGTDTMGGGGAGAGSGAGGFAGSFGTAGSFGGSGSSTTTTGVGGSRPGGGAAGTGFPPDGGSGGFGPSGFWHFDDCSPTSNFLIDSSGSGAHAQHAINRTCAPGMSGLGVQFSDKKDIVQVADQPQFTVGPRVAVAAWVNPTAIDKDHPIVLKRLDNNTSFSLGIHKGNLEMSVVLTTGKTFISRAPIEANAWTHVAGMYDGRFVFLFMNGEQVGQVAAAGTLRNVFAPIRIGATTGAQHFDGVIDEVWLSTNVVSKEEITGLSCILRPTTVAITPAHGGPVSFDTPVNYQVNVKNNDVGSCGTSQYQVFLDLFAGGPPPGSDGGVPREGGAPVSNAGLQAFVNPQFMTLDPGASGIFSADVSASEDTETGVHQLPFSVIKFGRNFEFFRADALFELEPTGCFVRTRRELMITNPSVVDDPVRTAFDPTVPTSNPESRGVWTFARLMRDMAPTAEQAPDMTERMFRTWLTDQTVNGFTVLARPSMQQQVLDNWPRTPDGKLNLERAPLMLQAIVNRIDVRNLAQGNAGEGRFVFAVMGPFGPLEFTVILEYHLIAQAESDVLEWANLWHGLSLQPFPSEAYNAALEAITVRFSGRNSGPGRVNGNALAHLRTNEITLSSFQWELREFVLSPESQFLDETTVSLTPDAVFNGTQTLADYVNQNESAIIAEQHSVPDQFQGVSFAGGAVFNNQNTWFAQGIFNNEARHKFSLNTCNGCHGPEAGSGFLQITPRRSPGGEAFLSPFLLGTTVFDQSSGQVRQLNDLARRRVDLASLVCPPTAQRSLVKAAGATSIAKGISRVH
ncbi:MAG TPA: LamG domain-containing protein [Polyangiaceae bacterium]|nr:LamG domain-containing protein [Polyangiaceae bacterium]